MKKLIPLFATFYIFFNQSNAQVSNNQKEIKRKRTEAYKTKQIAYFNDMTTPYNTPPFAWGPYSDKQGNKYGFIYVNVQGYNDYKVLNIYKVTPEGKTYLYVDGENNTLNVFTRYDKRYDIPVMDDDGNVYFADNNDYVNKIWKITNQGKLIHLAGGKKQDGEEMVVKDGQGTSATVDEVHQIKIGKDGNFYFTNRISMYEGQKFSDPSIKLEPDSYKAYYAVLRKMTPDGNITTLHSSTGEPIRFHILEPFEVDSKGNVYFTRFPKGGVYDKADFCVYDPSKKEIRKLFNTGAIAEYAGDKACDNLNFVLGDANKALVKGITKIFSTSNGSLLLFSTATNKWVKFDGKTLSHFSGKKIPLDKGKCTPYNRTEEEDGTAISAMYNDWIPENMYQVGEDIFYSTFKFIGDDNNPSFNTHDKPPFIYKLGKDGSKTTIHSYTGSPKTGYTKTK